MKSPPPAWHIVVIRLSFWQQITRIGASLAGMCVALTWWERGWLMEKGGQRKKEGVDLRVTAATEDDSGKAQLGSYSDACCIQNNTITCNHSLNCYPGDWKTSWWKTIKEDQNKGLLRVVAHGLLIEVRRTGCETGGKGNRKREERGWSNLAMQTDGGY